MTYGDYCGYQSLWSSFAVFMRFSSFGEVVFMILTLSQHGLAIHSSLSLTSLSYRHKICWQILHVAFFFIPKLLPCLLSLHCPVSRPRIILVVVLHLFRRSSMNINEFLGLFLSCGAFLPFQSSVHRLFANGFGYFSFRNSIWWCMFNK